MRVERFSLFFGPLLVKFRRGETDYGIGPIPLGGYVKITGMNPHEELPEEVAPRAYYNQPVWKRVVVILAGPAVNLVIAFALLFGIIWANGLVKYNSHNQPVFSHRVDSSGLEAPATQYLRPGDQIVAVDGERNLAVDQISKQIASHKCTGAPTAGCAGKSPVELLVRRGRQLVTFSIYPRYDPALKRMRIGFSFAPVIQAVGPVTAAGKSVSQMWTVTRDTVATIVKLFEPKVRKQLHGIVGGFKVTQERFAFDTTDALYTLAIISLSLGVINLFPFLPLDGGHVFWALAEKARRRRIPFEVMERAGAVGFVLIMVVFVIGLSNDISTLTGPGFSAR
jgi:regulator of sigma E protease